MSDIKKIAEYILYNRYGSPENWLEKSWIRRSPVYGNDEFSRRINQHISAFIKQSIHFSLRKNKKIYNLYAISGGEHIFSCRMDCGLTPEENYILCEMENL